MPIDEYLCPDCKKPFRFWRVVADWESPSARCGGKKLRKLIFEWRGCALRIIARRPGRSEQVGRHGRSSAIARWAKEMERAGRRNREEFTSKISMR